MERKEALPELDRGLAFPCARFRLFLPLGRDAKGKGEEGLERKIGLCPSTEKGQMACSPSPLFYDEETARSHLILAVAAAELVARSGSASGSGPDWLWA